MLIVAGTITIDPTKIDIAREAAATMMAATHAEPGNIDYAFSFDAADPATIRVFECWESRADLDNHFTLPHMDDFQEVVPELGITGMDIKAYEVASVGPVR